MERELKPTGREPMSKVSEKYFTAMETTLKVSTITHKNKEKVSIFGKMQSIEELSKRTALRE